jgi:plastocyanin
MCRMSGVLRRNAIALPLAVVSLALMPAGAWAVADVITNSGNQFTQGTYNSEAGDLVQFQHSGSGAPHNVTSTQSLGGQSLFSSATISTGTTPVNGTQFLTPGTYPFVCTIHAGMQATLNVSASGTPGSPPDGGTPAPPSDGGTPVSPSDGGTPVSRPDIELEIISRKLDKVAAKGKLVLEVLAITKSDDVSVSARLGKKTVGESTDLDLAAGQKSKVALKLKRGVRRKLAKLDKAKVTAQATVPFGEPDTAKRVLK